MICRSDFQKISWNLYSGLALIRCRFQFYTPERLETVQCLESRFWWHDPINLVKSRDQVRIVKAVLYFTVQFFSAFSDCSVKYPIFETSIWNFQGLFLTSIVTILQNCLKLAYLEVAFHKIVIFRILVCNLQTGLVMSKICFDVVPRYRYQYLVKFS